jgi:hypothetical protein
MKTQKKILVAIALIAASSFYAGDASAQTRKLPDGTIVYPDGTRRLPNGTIIYKDGKQVENNGSTVTLPDGTVIYPDRDANYPRTRTQARKAKSLPPGQAKKIYGGSAKDYAPGQQKKNKDWNHANGNNGKHGKGKKD